jgi:hypothetical protein
MSEKRTYHVALKMKNKKLRTCVLERILNSSFISKICVTEENDIVSNRMFADVPGDLIVFDDIFDSEAEAKSFCKAKLETSPGTLFVHISKAPVRDNDLHLIGITEKFFLEHFSQLLGVCFMIYVVKQSVSNVKGILKEL